MLVVISGACCSKRHGYLQAAIERAPLCVVLHDKSGCNLVKGPPPHTHRTWLSTIISSSQMKTHSGVPIIGCCGRYANTYMFGTRFHTARRSRPQNNKQTAADDQRRKGLLWSLCMLHFIHGCCLFMIIVSPCPPLALS